MKIHKKLFSGIPLNFTLFVISPKLRTEFEAEILDLQLEKYGLHLISKHILLPVEPWGMRMLSA